MEDKMIDFFAGGMRTCKDIQGVDAAFKLGSIEKSEDKIKILQKAMSAQIVHYTPGITEEQKLRIEIDTFIKGDWR